MSSNSEKSPPGSRWKNLLKNLALSAAVFLFCLLAAELVLRIMGYGNIEIYEPDPVVFWKLKPGQKCYTKIDHRPVRINSRGTRGREFDVPKPVDTIRIISIGDSRTFGWGLSDEETYSALLEKLLQEKFSSRKKIEVINCGVNAWSFGQMAAYFKNYALSWQPDMVVLGAANGWTQFTDNNDPQFVKQFMSRVRLKNLLRRFALYHYVVEVQLQNYYQRYKSKFVPVDPRQDQLFKEHQKSDPYAVFREAIENLCLVARSNNVQPVLLYIPTQDSYLRTNSLAEGVKQTEHEISRKLGVPLLDLTEDIRPEAPVLYLDADPVHLNARGNEIIGRRLSEVVSPLLKP